MKQQQALKIHNVSSAQMHALVAHLDIAQSRDMCDVTRDVTSQHVSCASHTTHFMSAGQRKRTTDKTMRAFS